MRCTNASAFKGQIDGIRKRQMYREAEMSYLQNSYSVGFKAKVALEAIRGARTIP